MPEGLERDGVVLRRLRARDAGPFAAAFREDPELGVLIGADEDPTENGVRRFIARQPGLRARGEFLGLAVTDDTRKPRVTSSLTIASRRWSAQRVVARCRENPAPNNSAPCAVASVGRPMGQNQKINRCAAFLYKNRGRPPMKT